MACQAQHGQKNMAMKWDMNIWKVEENTWQQKKKNNTTCSIEFINIYSAHSTSIQALSINWRNSMFIALLHGAPSCHTKWLLNNFSHRSTYMNASQTLEFKGQILAPVGAVLTLQWSSKVLQTALEDLKSLPDSKILRGATKWSRYSWYLQRSSEIPDIEISMQIGNQISQQVGSAMSAAWMFNPWRTNSGRCDNYRAIGSPHQLSVIWIFWWQLFSVDQNVDAECNNRPCIALFDLVWVATKSLDSQVEFEIIWTWQSSKMWTSRGCTLIQGHLGVRLFIAARHITTLLP